MARIRTRKAIDSNTEKKIASNGENKSLAVEEARKERSAAKPGGIINRIPVVRSIVAYFRGVASEMQKVTWPSREETSRLTGVVLGVTVAFAVTLGLLDAFFSWWFRQAFHADSEIIFLGIAAALIVVISGSYVSLRNRI